MQGRAERLARVDRRLRERDLGEAEIGEALKRLDAACVRMERGKAAASPPALSGAAE